MKTLILLLSALTCSAATFQELIDGAGPVLTLAPGVYHGPVVIERDIEIRGGPGVEITADDYGSAIRVAFDFEVSISGVTFRDTYGEEGGAIVTIGTLAVSNCIFTNNLASHDGGAIKVWFGDATISDCTFVRNEGAYGGAVSASAFAHISLANCTFENNEAYEVGSSGGAIHIADGSLNGCVIRNNVASRTDSTGGGAYFSGSVTLANTTICGNWAPEGPDYYGPFTDEGGNNICSSIVVLMIDGIPQVNVGGLGIFELQGADSPLGPWETLATDTAPFTFSDGQKAAVRFYRIVQR